MSTRRAIPLDDPLYSLTWYMRGYFPLYDIFSRFYWERLPERAVIPINAATAKRAEEISRRGKCKFRLVKNQSFDACIMHLQNPRIKEFSWVRTEVVRIYEALRARGLLLTLEAHDERGRLAGGLVGIVLPGVFIAETMFTLVPDASKVCLCALVAELHRRNFLLMDVQTRHDRDPWGEVPDPEHKKSPHPCVRLGEQLLPVEQFMGAFQQILTANGFSTPEQWLAAATAVTEAQRCFLSGDPGPAFALRRNPPAQTAIPWLTVNLDPRFASAMGNP